MSPPIRGKNYASAVSMYRTPRDDELSVMTYMVNHIKHCRTCSIPQERTKLALLCPRGQSYAMDVEKYFYLRDGKVISVVDSRTSRSKVEVIISSDYQVILRLLGRLRSHNQIRCHSTPAMGSSSRQAFPHEQTARATDAFITVYVKIPSITIPVQVRTSDLSHRPNPRLD